MSTSLFKARSVYRTNEQRINYGTEDINVLQYNRLFMFMDSNHLYCEENWTHVPSASGSYVRLVGWQTIIL